MTGLDKKTTDYCETGGKYLTVSCTTEVERLTASAKYFKSDISSTAEKRAGISGKVRQEFVQKHKKQQ